MKQLIRFFHLKKGDFIIFVCIFAIILVSTLSFYGKSTEAKVLKIYRNSTEYATYSLSYDYEKNINIPVSDEYNAGYNHIRIKDGVVSMVESTCPNQDCMKMAPISRGGDVLICLPHQLVIRLEGGDELDALSY